MMFISPVLWNLLRYFVVFLSLFWHTHTTHTHVLYTYVYVYMCETRSRRKVCFLYLLSAVGDNCDMIGLNYASWRGLVWPRGCHGDPGQGSCCLGDNSDAHIWRQLPVWQLSRKQPQFTGRHSSHAYQIGLFPPDKSCIYRHPAWVKHKLGVCAKSLSVPKAQLQTVHVGGKRREGNVLTAIICCLGGKGGCRNNLSIMWCTFGWSFEMFDFRATEDMQHIKNALEFLEFRFCFYLFHFQCIVWVGSWRIDNYTELDTVKLIFAP